MTDINPFAGMVEKDADINPFAGMVEKKDYTLGEVLPAAAESLKKTAAGALKTVEEAVRNPRAAAAKVAEGVGSMVMGALETGSLPVARGTIYPTLKLLAPETAEEFRKNFIAPGEKIEQHYIEKYGGWENVKRAIAEEPISTAADVAGIAPMMPRGFRGATTTTADAALTRLRSNGLEVGQIASLSPVQVGSLMTDLNARGWNRQTVQQAYRESLATEAQVTPTEGMMTGQVKHLEAEDKMRHGARGSQAEEAMKAADKARQDALAAASLKLRSGITGFDEPMPPAVVGYTLSERFNEAHARAKQGVRQAYVDAFDPEKLQIMGIIDHIPENVLRDTPSHVRNKMMGGDQPFVATPETAPNTVAATKAIDDFSRTGRLPMAVPGEVMPPPGVAGVSWHSMDMLRKYLNGLRESAKSNPTDLFGMRRVLDAFDEQIGKANPLLNEARSAHKERVDTFDPNRRTSAAGLKNITTAAANVENTGYTLYNKLFDSAGFKRGEGLKIVEHLKKIFDGDPVALQAMKEGALERLLNDPKTFDPLSPRKAATQIGQALKGRQADTYRAMFSAEELARLRRHHDLLDMIDKGMVARNPSKTSYSQAAENQRVRHKAYGAVAGGGAGHFLGMPSFVGETIGGAAGAALSPALSWFPNTLAGRRATRASAPEMGASPPTGPSPAGPLSLHARPETRARGGVISNYAEGGEVVDENDSGSLFGKSYQQAAPTTQDSPAEQFWRSLGMPTGFGYQARPRFKDDPAPPLPRVPSGGDQALDYKTDIPALPSFRTPTGDEKGPAAAYAKIVEQLRKAGVSTAARPVAATAPGGDLESYVKYLLPRESSNDPNAVNTFSPDGKPPTRAAGIYQFLPGTVESLTKADPALAKIITDDWRTDKTQQNALLKAYTRQSDELLKAHIGDRAPTHGERYLYHLLGHGGGNMVMKKLDTPLGDLLSSEVFQYNPRVLKPAMTGRQLLESFGGR